MSIIAEQGLPIVAGKQTKYCSYCHHIIYQGDDGLWRNVRQQLHTCPTATAGREGES